MIHPVTEDAADRFVRRASTIMARRLLAGLLARSVTSGGRLEPSSGSAPP
ncbi:hypothetical protein [Paludisphaera soli]|nr:hypothetical protein [Paludisphaera soli]